VAKDELVHKHTNTMDLLETDIAVIVILEDVVVATDQTLLAVHPLYQFKIPLVDDNVTQEVDSILWTNDRVVPLDHSLVHLVSRGEWAQR
jgi:hypothetical protein